MEIMRRNSVARHLATNRRELRRFWRGTEAA
jgi:hypothetical protein